MTSPNTVEESANARFTDLNLRAEILADVADLGYEKPTAIQSAAIPAVLSGRDVIAVAQTGTGKTAAFGLPLIERLGPGGGPRAMILSPTRELTIQSYECLRQMGKTTGVTATMIIGGESFGEQNRELGENPDFVVGTPGRVLDQIQRGRLITNRIEALVLDEADRLLDMGFLPQLRDILRRLPAERQTLLFSATMPPTIQALCREFLYEPLEVTVGPTFKAVDSCIQELYVGTARDKVTILKYLLRQDEVGSVLVFTRTRRGADELYRSIRDGGHNVTVLHADRRQEARRKSMDGFRDGSYRILVATDIASRGLDVDGIARVINFDIPPTTEDYLHRIGRTARADKEGHASTFATMEDLGSLRTIEAGTGEKIPSVVIPRAELNEFAREEHAREYKLAQERKARGEGNRRDEDERDRLPPRGGRRDGPSRGGRRPNSSSNRRPRR